MKNLLHSYLNCMGFIFIISVSATDPLQYNLVEGLPNVYIAPMAERIGHTWSQGVVWEKHLIEKFYSILNNHNDFFVVIDLGAQTGCFSLLSKYFPDSMWYAFEPIVEAVDVLKENLCFNGIKNVQVYNMAALDYAGTTILRMPSMGAWGLSTVGSNPLRFNQVIEREIACIDLDSFVTDKQIQRVHFMKLDTEGSELYILRGAQKMIMRDHPIILMEYNETNMKQCGVSRHDVDAFLNAMGYTWQLISSEDILCVPIQ